MSSFFTAGGTLKLDAPSYVPRAADQALLRALVKKEFAYVLDSRQKGKSSLMIRTRIALESQGIKTVVLDLQRFGSNLGPEQWYGSMLSVIGQDLEIEDQLLDLWDRQAKAGPMKRFFGALQMGLENLGALVVFIDEIDFVRSLPFSTDEFFAGIREAFNRRADGTESNLTFCLLGVATPSELIRDVQITPFNIGTRIELTDFTLEELSPYAQALTGPNRDGAALIRRIHYWTGGHPYLTQKLTQTVANDPGVRSQGGVDRVAEALFLSTKARSEEPNLADVSRRVLETPVEGIHPEETRARVLDLYQQVRAGKRVKDDETDPIATVLKLSGLTSILQGYLTVRNRVYFRAFDRAWVEANLPDAEIQRQRRAARTATLRVGAVAALVTMAIGSLAVFGLLKASEAEDATAEAKKLAWQESNARQDAANRAKEARTASEMAVQRAEEAEKAKTELEAALSRANEQKQRADAKAEEARRANQQTQAALADATRAKSRAERERITALQQKTRADLLAKRERESLKKNTELLYRANLNVLQQALEKGDFSRARNILAATKGPEFDQYRGIEWQYANQIVSAYAGTIEGFRSSNHVLPIFGPNSETLLIETQDGMGLVNTAKSLKPQIEIKHSDLVLSAEFSKDGRYILTCAENRASVYAAATGALLQTINADSHEMLMATFSSDGEHIAISTNDNILSIYNNEGGHLLLRLIGHQHPIQHIRFSPDGTRLLTASANYAKLWDLERGELLETIENRYHAWNAGRVFQAEFSKDGSKFITAINNPYRFSSSFDGKMLTMVEGPDGFSPIQVVFSPDDKHLLISSTGIASIIHRLNLERKEFDAMLSIPSVAIAGFSPDNSRIVVSESSGALQVRENRGVFPEITRLSTSRAFTFSPDGRRIISVDRDGNLWKCDALHGGAIPRNLVTSPFPRESEPITIKSTDGVSYLFSSTLPLEEIRLLGATGGNFLAEASKNGTYIATIAKHSTVNFVDTSTVRLWDTHKGTLLHSMKARSSARDFSFSDDGKLLIVQDAKGLTLWCTTTGREISSINPSSRIYRFALTHDGTELATSHPDRTIRIWNSHSGHLLNHFDSSSLGNEIPMSMFFSPDGRRIMAQTDASNLIAEARASFHFWDVKSGVELLQVESSHSFNEATDEFLIGHDVFPLGSNAAARLAVDPIREIVKSLNTASELGNSYSWQWQTTHWLTADLERSSEAQTLFRMIVWSNLLELPIIVDAAVRMIDLPEDGNIRRIVDDCGNSGLFQEAARLLDHCASRRPATVLELKDLALLRLHLGNQSGWREAARSAHATIQPDTPADDVFQAAIAARAAPNALDDYAALLVAVERAAASDPQRFSTSASSGAILFRMGRYADAQKRLEASVKADNRFGQVFMAMTLAKLGRTDEAKAMLQSVEEWAKAKPVDGNAQTNLAAYPWDFRLELDILIGEARALLSTGMMPNPFFTPSPAPTDLAHRDQLVIDLDAWLRKPL